MKPAILILLCIVFTNCAGDPNPPPEERPKSVKKWSEPDARAQWQFDPSASFKLDFGRGSGWHGLETISLKDGKATLYRVAKEDH